MHTIIFAANPEICIQDPEFRILNSPGACMQKMKKKDFFKKTYHSSITLRSALPEPPRGLKCVVRIPPDVSQSVWLSQSLGGRASKAASPQWYI